MDNRNCKRCGKVFIYVSGYPLCKECREQDEEEYKKIREYIKSHPGVKIEDVANALEILPRQVLRYLQEERLEIPNNAEHYLICEFCGNVINTGRFCEDCKKLINKELNRQPNKTLGDNYFYNDDEERKIEKLKSLRNKFQNKY